MLKDEISITIQAGKGGDGAQTTYQLKATGGDGGQGGSVYFEGDENMYDLRSFKSNKTYLAPKGENGGGMNRRGANGENLILKVPLVTEVIRDGEVKHMISRHGQRELILSGGRCGVGNISIKRHHTYGATPKGEIGKLARVHLVLKLQSDIVFLGYPNAGKSSMLNELTSAKAKTASYAFTTLDPQIGYMDGIKLMDLPGLIEGSSEGKGLGIKFLKHTENCKLVAHFVSLENENPFEVYESLRREIKRISTDLYNKPEIILLTKSDEREEREVKQFVTQFGKKGLQVISCSILDEKAITLLSKVFKSSLSG